MRKKQLQKLIENELSGIAYDIGFQILDCLDEDDDIDESDFSDYVTQELDSYFTYYDDAWDYLQDNNITDFRDAMYEWNATDICAIAMYYAYTEICDEVSAYWEDYETDPDADEYDPEDEE